MAERKPGAPGVLGRHVLHHSLGASHSRTEEINNVPTGGGYVSPKVFRKAYTENLERLKKETEARRAPVLRMPNLSARPGQQPPHQDSGHGAANAVSELQSRETRPTASASSNLHRRSLAPSLSHRLSIQAPHKQSLKPTRTTDNFFEQESRSFLEAVAATPVNFTSGPKNDIKASHYDGNLDGNDFDVSSTDSASSSPLDALLTVNSPLAERSRISYAPHREKIDLDSSLRRLSRHAPPHRLSFQPRSAMKSQPVRDPHDIETNTVNESQNKTSSDAQLVHLKDVGSATIEDEVQKLSNVLEKQKLDDTAKPALADPTRNSSSVLAKPQVMSDTDFIEEYSSPVRQYDSPTQPNGKDSPVAVRDFVSATRSLIFEAARNDRRSFPLRNKEFKRPQSPYINAASGADRRKSAFPRAQTQLKGTDSYGQLSPYNWNASSPANFLTPVQDPEMEEEMSDDAPLEPFGEVVPENFVPSTLRIFSDKIPYIDVESERMLLKASPSKLKASLMTKSSSSKKYESAERSKGRLQDTGVDVDSPISAQRSFVAEYREPASSSSLRTDLNASKVSLSSKPSNELTSSITNLASVPQMQSEATLPSSELHEASEKENLDALTVEPFDTNPSAGYDDFYDPPALQYDDLQSETVGVTEKRDAENFDTASLTSTVETQVPVKRKRGRPPLKATIAANREARKAAEQTPINISVLSDKDGTKVQYDYQLDENATTSTGRPVRIKTAPLAYWANEKKEVITVEKPDGGTVKVVRVTKKVDPEEKKPVKETVRRKRKRKSIAYHSPVYKNKRKYTHADEDYEGFASPMPYYKLNSIPWFVDAVDLENSNAEQEIQVCDSKTGDKQTISAFITKENMNLNKHPQYKYATQVWYNYFELFQGGVLEIEPSGAKPSRSSCDCALIFFLLSGKIKAKVDTREFRLNRGSSFFVPPNTFYSVDNIEDEEPVRLYFTSTFVKT